MKRTFALTALFLASAPIAVAAQASNGNTGTVRAFKSTLPAAGIDKVKLEVKVGRISIKTSKADTIDIKSVATASEQMHFIFHWTVGNGSEKLPAGLHLVTHREGDTLIVGLASKDEKLDIESGSEGTSSGGINIHVSGHSHPGWKSDWTVVLPPRLAVDLLVGVGKARMVGLAGGVQAKVGVGKLDAWLPQGPIDANVGVGDIKAYVHSDDYGKVSLSAGVGHVDFYVHGRQNQTGYNKEFTSAKQSLTGPGKTAYKLTAGVGHVELKVGVKSLKPTDSGNMDTNADDE